MQRISEQFDEQPRLVDQVAKASRELDAIQAEVEKRLKGQPEEIKKFSAAIDAARGPVEAALLRPFREMEEAGGRQLEQMMLVLQGRESEAEALQRIEQYQARNGDLTEEQRLAILAQVEAERELGRLIEDRGRKLSIYNASIDDTRAALEDLLSGGSGRDFLKSMEQNFRQLQGRLLTEQLFGDALRKLEDLASGRDSLPSSPTTRVMSFVVQSFLAEGIWSPSNTQGLRMSLARIVFEDLEVSGRSLREFQEAEARQAARRNDRGLLDFHTSADG